MLNSLQVMKSILFQTTVANIIPLYVCIIGILGIIGILINSIKLLRKTNQPLTLEPRANLRQLPREDRLYQSFCRVESQPIDEAYKICSSQYQDILVNHYLPKISFSIGLTIVPIAYSISERIRVNEWGDSILILIGMVILPLSWAMGFLTRIYSLIFFGLVLSWAIYAISLSGRLLAPDTLLLFSILIYFIGVWVMFIAGNKGKDQNSNFTFGWVGSSILVIFALSAIRYFLPFVGSFTILLVIPAILMGCSGFGCLGLFLAIPILIISAIAERYFLLFPNSLLVACFFGLDIALLLLMLVPTDLIKHLLNEFTQRLGIVQAHDLPFPCQKCGASMEYIDSSKIDSYLSCPQQVARSLDSMQYFAWRCPQCYQSESAIHLRGYIQNKRYNNSRTWFEDCPTCQERTMVCCKTLASKSTSEFAGIKVDNKNFNVERKCACCNLVDSRMTSEHYIH